jgi:hypothetical protein
VRPNQALSYLLNQRTTDLVPGKHPWNQAWCLFEDARAVKKKLDALQLAGNKEVTDRWIARRRAVVHDRTQVFISNIPFSFDVTDISLWAVESTTPRSIP